MDSGLSITSRRDLHVGRWILLLLCLALLAGAGYYLYRWYTQGDTIPVPIPAFSNADPSIDETPLTVKQLNEYSVEPTHPRYISIPSLDIKKARVIPVGLTENSTLDTPRNISDTAWYTKSATPGSGPGALMINGHNGGVTRDGVFARLADLKKDDKIIIERGDGKKFTYFTKSNTTMSLAEANKTGMRTLMHSADPAREGLSLITCAGKWIPRDKVFDQRVMVRAVSQSEL
ncbi:MAG: class F sortase [Candidatus Saccharimonadales bacterium]